MREPRGAGQLVLDASVKTLAVSVLPRRLWLEVGGLDPDGLDPAPDRLRHELGAITLSERISLTVSLAYTSEPRRAGTSSINSAPNWTLSIVSPRRVAPKPMA